MSAAVLNAVFEAAIAAGSAPDALAQLGYYGLPNIMELGFWMCGGDSKHSRQAAVDTALRHLEPYESVLRYTAHLSKQQAAHILDPTRNKLSSLSAAQGLWQPTDSHGAIRESARIEELLEASEAVVIDLSPTGAYSRFATGPSAAFIAYALWDAIQAHCQDWQTQGRSVAVFSDEVGYLSPKRPPGSEQEDIAAQMAATGRRHGVMPVFATQNPNLIGDTTLEMFNMMGTRHYFRVNSPTSAREVSENVSDAFNPRQIAALPVGQCVTSMMRDGLRHRPFILCPQMEPERARHTTGTGEANAQRIGSAHEYRSFLSKALEHAHPELEEMRDAYEDAAEQATDAKSAADELATAANEALSCWDDALRRIASGHHTQRPDGVD